MFNQNFKVEVPYQIATQTSSGFSQMAVMLQLTWHTSVPVQFEGCTSQNKHSSLIGSVSEVTIPVKQHKSTCIKNKSNPGSAFGNSKCL